MVEKRHYQITVLTPLHIGDGEILRSATDFVSTDEEVFVLDHSSFLRELSRRGIAHSLVQELGIHGVNFNLSTFLRRHNLLKRDFLGGVSRYSLRVKGSPSEIRTFIKTLGRPYLPGSSIKGAIRIGMLYRLLKHLGGDFLKKFLYDRIERELDRLQCLSGSERREKRNKLRQRMGKFVDELLCIFRLKDDSQDPRTDILRCLRVNDSAPLDHSALSVVGIRVQKLNGQSSVTTWVEAIKPGRHFTITVEVDRELLDFFKKENPVVRLSSGGKIPFSLYERLFSEPFRPAVKLTRDFIEEEAQRVSQRWLPFRGRKPNFRLGWGQGLLTTTIFLLLPGDLRKRVRNELFKDEGAAEAPLTRKVSEEGLMGFCEVGLIKDRGG